MINNKGEEVGIIYGWYCTVTDMWYVGQTVRPEDRFKSHIILSENNDKSYFHKALRKYPLENWVYCVLEDNILRENLNMKEIDWIEYYDSFYSWYNLTLGGGGSVSRICTEETRKKISEYHKWLIGEKNPFYGRHHTEESKRKMSEARKGNTGLKGPKNGMYGKPAPNRKQVSKYDLNNNYIQTYNSIKDAIKENPKAVHLNDVCKGLRKQAGGFIWKYAS